MDVPTWVDATFYVQQGECQIAVREAIVQMERSIIAEAVAEDDAGCVIFPVPGTGLETLYRKSDDSLRVRKRVKCSEF